MDQGESSFAWFSWRDRLQLWALIAFGLLSVLWFADFWFFGDARRDPVWFPILTIALFWGVYRSVANWLLYFFMTPHVVQKAIGQEPPSIDVLTTAMPGEPYEMFAETLQSIQNITTPHRTFLLDGGNDPKLQNLCAKLGVEHIDCRGIQGAKAGKINHCLRNHSTSEFVLVIDPDHRPRPDLFEHVLPLFSDRGIGFVQVVQVYYNGTNSFVANAADEQTFGFYGPAMMSLNGLSIATAIGANCVFRRAALDSIGGHAEHLAEDALTSMRIHAQGWKSTYYPYRGSEGLVPEDLGSFFKQQYKWATGMFYLFFKEYPKLFWRLPWAGRIHYFNAGTFYFGGIATMLTLCLPFILLLTRQYAVEFALGDFLIHLAPYTLATFATYIHLQKYYTHSREKRLPWRSMILDKSTWHVFAMGLLSALLGKKVQYLPTPKESDRSPMPMLVWPHLVVIPLSLLAILYGFWGYARLEGGTLLMMFFAALNIVLLAPMTWIALFPQFNWRRNHV